MLEEWKFIDGYDNLYQVSNLGRIKSLRYNKERILKSVPNGTGYLRIKLGKKSKNYFLHKLVATYFIPNDDKGRDEVNHINCDKLNNTISNLEWVNHRENVVSYYQNKSGRKSKYIGVSTTPQNKWRSSIYLNGKNINIGWSFDTELEAYQARINFEKENNITNKYIN